MNFSHILRSLNLLLTQHLTAADLTMLLQVFCKGCDGNMTGLNIERIHWHIISRAQVLVKGCVKHRPWAEGSQDVQLGFLFLIIMHLSVLVISLSLN